jgi:hypothetical protein
MKKVLVARATTSRQVVENSKKTSRGKAKRKN